MLHVLLGCGDLEALTGEAYDVEFALGDLNRSYQSGGSRLGILHVEPLPGEACAAHTEYVFADAPVVGFAARFMAPGWAVAGDSVAITPGSLDTKFAWWDDAGAQIEGTAGTITLAEHGPDRVAFTLAGIAGCTADDVCTEPTDGHLRLTGAIPDGPCVQGFDVADDDTERCRTADDAPNPACE